ncbi:MAG: hypothetical protein O7D35_04910 [Acidobacteria bacterium]|nr:hypothetical protein [Acidobacteriota bacterium]
MTIGILGETREGERRAALTPDDVAWLVKQGVPVLVEKNPQRIFTWQEYEQAGARLVTRAHDAGLLMGIKEPRIGDLMPGRIYSVFSHTIKGQDHNMPLLRAFLDGRITLLDYEAMVDGRGKRLIYFGRFAGICGMLDSLHCLGARLALRGLTTPLSLIRPAWQYASLEEARTDLVRAREAIAGEGLPLALSPFIIGVTGHGNVSRGAQEILDELDPVEILPRRMESFTQHEQAERHRIFKIVLEPEEKLRRRDKGEFYMEEYLADPDRFESNLDRYLPHLTLLIHTSYWDERYPRLVTKKLLQELSRAGRLRLEMIGDLSCDIRGSIEITSHATTSRDPVFTYDHIRDRETNGLAGDGITVLAVDNLPTELPRDASRGFSSQIREYAYQVATCGLAQGEESPGVQAGVRRGLVTHDGRLTRRFAHLSDFVGGVRPRPSRAFSGPSRTASR